MRYCKQIIWALLLLSFPSPSKALTCTQPPSGIISWWRAEGNAIDTIGHYDGTLMNDTTFGTGKVGSAFSFDGSNQFVQVPDNDLWTLGRQNFTVELWVNFNQIQERAAFIGHDEGGGSLNKWTLFYDELGNNSPPGPALRFHINGPSVGIVDPIYATWTPTVGQWYHVAVTRNGGSTYALYINGSQVATSTQTDSIPDATASLTIGNAEGFFFNGLLDEVTIYNRALTATEIQSIYNAGSAGKCIQSPPAAPVLITPVQNATSIPISTNLTWNASSSATSYRVQLSTDSTFATTVVDDSTITTTNKSVGPLANNTTYYWRVNAKNDVGTSTYSSTWRFTTIPAIPTPPVLATPTNGSSNVPISTNLTWNISSGATSYRLQLTTDSLFSNLIVNDSTLSGTIKSVGPLANSTSYFWRVNAKNSGGTSAYSAVWRFTTIIAAPSIPILSDPANNATIYSTSANLTWNASAGATSYHVQVSTNSGFTTTVLDDSTLTTTTRNFPYTNYMVYYWRVNAKNAGGTSAYSPTWSFTTSPVGIVPQEFALQRLNLENGESLRFGLPQKAHVVIQLFNSKGQMISQLLNETREAGYYIIPLSSEAKGSYFLDFRAGDFHRTMKIER
jgi:hypothetical protein